MSERHEYQEILDRARQLARMPIEAGAARGAVAAVRGQLGGGRVTNRGRGALLVLSGSLAAAVALAVALAAMMAMQPRRVDAAELLQNAADATKDYRGWVHITPVGDGGLFSAFKPHVESIHINTADGTFAVVAKIYGSALVEIGSPATREMRMYTGISQTIVVSRVEGDATTAARRGADFPLRLADYLKQFKARGVAAPNVAESTDQGLERFDLTLGDDAKKTPDLYPELPDGKLTLWVDPQTKLIRRMTGKFDDQNLVMEYTYGAPEIADIYDLGVPKTAQIVDNRGSGGDGKGPAVFDLPPTAQLVKDESMDVKALAARLQKHSDGDWGDFVSVECSEIIYVSGRGHAQGHLTIAARQGGKSLYSIYLLAPEMVLWGGQGFPKGWPTPKLEDVVAELQTAWPSRIDCFDGRNGWHGEPPAQRIAPLQVKPTTRDSASGLVRTGTFPWPSMSGVPAQLGTRTAEILSDPARPGLIVLHTVRNLTYIVYKGTTSYRAESWYWLDPARDDLPVEMVKRDNSAGGDQLDTAMHDVYPDFGRLADGRWYPSHWQSATIRNSTTQPDKNDGYVEYWRQILPDEKLAPAWYGDPNLRMTGAELRLPATEPAR